MSGFLPCWPWNLLTRFEADGQAKLREMLLWGLLRRAPISLPFFCGIFAWCCMFFPRFCWEFATSKNVTLHAEWEIKAEDSEPLDFRCAWGSIFCFRSWVPAQGWFLDQKSNLHEIMKSWCLHPKDENFLHVLLVVAKKVWQCPCAWAEYVSHAPVARRLCDRRKDRCLLTQVLSRICCDLRPIQSSTPFHHHHPRPSHCLPSWPSSRPAPHSRGLPGQSQPVLHLLWPRKLQILQGLASKTPTMQQPKRCGPLAPSLRSAKCWDPRRLEVSKVIWGYWGVSC